MLIWHLQQAAEAGPGLSEVLTPEVTVPLVLSDDAALERLAPFLPEQHRWVRRSLVLLAMVILAMLFPEVLGTKASLNVSSEHVMARPGASARMLLAKQPLAGRAVSLLLIPQHEMVRLCKRRTREQAVATLQSPQFRRTLDVFSAALVSGRLDLRHFGLDPQVGCPRPTSFCGGQH